MSVSIRQYSWVSLDATKADLHGYLQAGREALVWKLDGLAEYDARRPMVPTATNLLGIVKHVASVESEYLGEVFERPFGEPFPWYDEGAEPNADMWVTVRESREEIVALYHRVWVHSDATIAALDLDAVGRVPWWPPERREVTLGRILAHLIAETHRHAGHADVVRELIDGSVGVRAGRDNLPAQDEAWWQSYRARVEDAARDASARADD
jgi:Protein of unknown function (DUF664)